MNPIAPPTIISNGIAVYFPPTVDQKFSLITLEIYFSKSNPVFSWIACNTSTAKLWSKTLQQSAKGSLFVYETRGDLPYGFYTIAVKSVQSSGEKRGQLSLGVIEPTPHLIVGLPYSIYPTINLA